MYVCKCVRVCVFKADTSPRFVYMRQTRLRCGHWMYVYICMCVYVYICVYVYMYICVCVHIYMRSIVFFYFNVCVYMCVRVYIKLTRRPIVCTGGRRSYGAGTGCIHVYICVYLYLLICICIYLYINVCICICVCIGLTLTLTLNPFCVQAADEATARALDEVVAERERGETARCDSSIYYSHIYRSFDVSRYRACGPVTDRVNVMMMTPHKLPGVIHLFLIHKPIDLSTFLDIYRVYPWRLGLTPETARCDKSIFDPQIYRSSDVSRYLACGRVKVLCGTRRSCCRNGEGRDCQVWYIYFWFTYLYIFRRFSMSRPLFAFLIEKLSTRAEGGHFIAKWQITVVFSRCVVLIYLAV